MFIMKECENLLHMRRNVCRVINIVSLFVQRRELCKYNGIETFFFFVCVFIFVLF